MIKKKKNVISMKAQLYIVTSAVLLLAMFGVFVAWLDSSMEWGRNNDDQSAKVILRDITLKGESTCLGHKGDGPSTMECGIGIKLPSGDVYAIQGGDSSSLGASNKTIEVTGKLTIPGDSVYKSDGTLTVK